MDIVVNRNDAHQILSIKTLKVYTEGFNGDVYAFTPLFMEWHGSVSLTVQ
jgi:hypothetical protein